MPYLQGMQKIAATFFILFLFIGAAAQELPYSVCTGCWNPDSLGNQRAVVRCPNVTASRLAEVRIPWRRRDQHPERKRIIVQDSSTGKRVRNVRVWSVTREEGDIVFEPISGEGTYYVYYLPYRNEGRSNYPRGVYWKPDTTASDAWLKKLGANGSRFDVAWPPKAVAVGIQAIDSFNTAYPMEVLATEKEVAALKAQYRDSNFLVFPEGREYPIRMERDLPYRWIERGPGERVDAVARPGENYAYELGFCALRASGNVHVVFGGFRNAEGRTIPADSMVCINTDGVRYDGRPFVKRVDVAAGQVQPLWCVVKVPEDAAGTMRERFRLWPMGMGWLSRFSYRWEGRR